MFSKCFIGSCGPDCGHFIPFTGVDRNRLKMPTNSSASPPLFAKSWQTMRRWHEEEHGFDSVERLHIVIDLPRPAEPITVKSKKKENKCESLP
jgi:hypothetical protein